MWGVPGHWWREADLVLERCIHGTIFGIIVNLGTSIQGGWAGPFFKFIGMYVHDTIPFSEFEECVEEWNINN